MVRLTVLYGQPTDPQAFDDYYARVHIPIARKMRGWFRWTLEKVVATPGEPPPPYHLIVGLYAASVEEVQRILATPLVASPFSSLRTRTSSLMHRAGRGRSVVEGRARCAVALGRNDHV